MPLYIGSNKIYVGNNKQLPKIWSNSNIGHYGFQSGHWTWSNLRFSGSANSFKFVPDPDNGGLQGDFSIGTGSATSAYPTPQSTYDLNGHVYEIEPAGGTGEFSMIGRDLSYTLKLGPIFTSYQYTKPDNTMTFSECKFMFTNCTNYVLGYKHTLYPSGATSGNTYIQFQIFGQLRPTTVDGLNVPSKNATSDYTLSFSIGPNNTPEVAYTDVNLIGFQNESAQTEYFQDSSIYGNYEYKHKRNVPFSYLESERGYKGVMPKDMTVLRIWQKPNILFYTHIKFINLQYVDYDNPPSNANVLEHWSVNWATKQEEILVYIEFGVSPNGGKTIWWNGVESDSNIGGTTGAKLAARGITSVVPNDINKYLTATLLNYSTKPTGQYNQNPGTVNRYNISTANATVHGTKAFKYVRIPIWTDDMNDETHNMPKDRYQHYKPINFKDLTTSTTATHSDDPDIDATTKLRQNDYWSKWQANSQSLVQFQIGRKYKTNPWSTDVHIDLFYQKDSLKYVGSTDGQTVTSK